jgi:uncharacterized membrane protein YwzB
MYIGDQSHIQQHNYLFFLQFTYLALGPVDLDKFIIKSAGLARLRLLLLVSLVTKPQGCYLGFRLPGASLSSEFSSTPERDRVTKRGGVNWSTREIKLYQLLQLLTHQSNPTHASDGQSSQDLSC